MSRNSRQAKILEIVADREIETQDDIVRILNESGFKVTQATVSRDIKELGLVKTQSNAYKYLSVKSNDIKISNKFLNVYREAVLTMTVANNMIVVKTLEGSANAVAMVIDQLQFPETLGTIAGDDTILVVAKNNENAEILYGKLTRIID